MKRAIKHLKKAHAAAIRNDHKAVMFHAGHVLAATRQAMKGGPEELNLNEQEPDQDDTTMGKKELGVPQGKKIPANKINAASHPDNPTLARRANLAKTLKKLRSK